MQRRQRLNFPQFIAILAHLLVVAGLVSLVYVSLRIATREEAYQVRVHPPHNITKDARLDNGKDHCLNGCYWWGNTQFGRRE